MLMKKRFNKFLTLLAVLLLGFGQMWADSETVPKTTDNWTGTSCSLTHAECANGSANAPKDGDASSVTYIKFRTNKNGNTMTFEVNEGYKVTGFSIRGYANDNSKAVGLTSVKYDSADPIEVNQSFPNKNAGTTYTYNNTTDEATSAIVLSFGTNAGTQIMAVITITYEEASSGPVDPTITFNDGAYTIGGSALDLSSLFSSNSSGEVTYSVKTDGGTSASIDGTSFTATAAGTCVVTASQAAVSGTYNAKAVDANIVVSAPVLVSSVSVTAPVDGNTYYVGNQVTLAATVLPENATNKTLNWTMDVSDKATIADGKITFIGAGDFHLTASATDGSGKSNKVHLYVSNPTLITSIALDYNEQHINVGDVITITPTILPVTATNKNLLWSVTEGATITQEGVLTAVAPSDVIVTAAAQDGSDVEGTSHIYIDPLPACATLTPATSGSAIAAGDAIDLEEVSPNASMKALTANLSYTENGLLFASSSSTKAEVTLNNLMQVGTIITATIYNADDSKARGLKLLNSEGTSKATWTKKATGDHVETYTVVAGDGLAGSNVFQLQRSENAYLKDISIANCGAELLDLSSAVTPDHDPAYATVTLSATKIVAGGSATASYSIAEPTYWDFDGWEITSGDATIADATADEAAVTMGTTASVITLKLKAAGVKHTVTYRDENDVNLGEELVNEGQHPVGLSIAPRKLGYTFAGWGLSKAGPVVAFSDVTVNDDMSLYTIWNEIDCSAQSGTIYSMSITVPPAQNCTIKTASGFESTLDLFPYGGIVGGEAMLSNTGSSNNCILQSDGKIVLKDNVSCLKLDFDCPLKEGDKIQSSISGNTAWVSTDATRPSGTSTALAVLPSSATGEFVIPAASDLIDAQTIYIWKGGGNTTITSISIVRPAHFDVTFNMHGHGDAVDPQSVVEGGKVTKPTDPTASGWDFGGWFTDDTYGTYWDFENMTISAATEIHAQWTVHSTSTDASLSDLQVNGVTVPEFATTKLVYNVELPMGTTVVPTVVATPTDANAVATVDPCTLAGATITVVPESGVGDKQVYTINFSIATSKDIQLVFKTGTTPCVGSASTATQILSNNAAVSTYINQITFTNVEGSGDDGAEGSSLNVGKKAGNMFTLSAKAGFALQSMNFLAKIQDADCEYSINGGAWTTLTSTNTGADECYAPFSAAEVHEFRLRSTGASGVWIRNMQLTIIEACTPVVITWDEEPVEFEVGKAGYAIAATANNGGAITYASVDNTVIDVNASTGALTIAGLGSVALSASTPEGDGTTYCANGGDPIVLSKTVNTYYLVTFDGQNGEAADEVKYFSGGAPIAQPTDPSFPGHTFQGWFDAASAGNPVVFPLTPSASRTIYAQWTADCTAPTIDVQPASANYFTGRTAAALNCEATAAGGNALTYTWYSCDDELRTNPVELSGVPTPSTAAAGTSYFFCAVTEEGCANVANSNVAVITVTDKDPICLAWVDVTGQNAASLDASKSLFAPSVSAAGIKNSEDYDGKTGWKFNSDPGYIAIEGAPFKSGDIVEMFVTHTTADKARVFNANEAIAANIIAEGAANMVQGANRVALTADANSLYLRRGNDFGGWNPYVAYVAVYRACAPILNKVTVAGVDGTPDNTNHVAIEVPFSTTDAALSSVAIDWISNNAAWDAAHDPAVANTWEFGVENTVTLTDKDGDESVYYVTISKAAASSDATLSALTVNGQEIALADGVFEYSFELPYGTSAAPTVVATPNHVAAVATVDPCTLSGATITVVPESGAGDQQVYTLTFVISKWKEVAIWDGSYMTEVATSPDATTGMAWTVNGFSSITNYNATCGTKAYTKTLPSGGGASTTRNVAFTVPAGYVAKFYIAFGTHSDGNNRGMFIGSNATKTLDATSVLTLYSNSRTNLTDGTSEIVGAGTYYLNPMESVDFYEIRAFLRPGYGRTDMLGNGVLGTVCVDHNVAVEDIQGVSVYELVGREPQYGKVAFDEIVSGGLEAGAPYVFQAHGDRMVLFFGDTKVDDPVDKGNGMYGTFSAITLTELDDVYYFAQRALWSCVDLSSLSVPANRAYVMLSEIDYISDPNPAPGRRRILMGVNGETQAQGFENLDASEKPLKVMIDGTLYILRGEKVFDATGRLVK